MSNTHRAWILAGALGLGAGLGIGLGTGQGALACAFHGYTPDPTLVDLLLETEQVVIARPDPSMPARYVAVEALMGPEALDIPLTVDPAIGTRVAADPAATVLLARDGAYGPWLELAVLDPAFRGVVEHVLHQQAAWLWGGEDGRLRYFAERLNHPNPDIRRLALREMDRLDYAVLKAAPLPAVARLRQDLASGDGDLMPIRVLLAGLSGEAGLAPVLWSDLDAAVERQVPYLGAYATAVIELEGAVAVDALLRRYVRDRALPLETREKLLEALAIQHKTTSGPVRRAIARGVADSLRAAPELSEAAARQFGFRSHWSLTPPTTPDQSTAVDR